MGDQVSEARSCLKWPELFWETKSGEQQLCYFLCYIISFYQMPKSSSQGLGTGCDQLCPYLRSLPGQLVLPTQCYSTSHTHGLIQRKSVWDATSPFFVNGYLSTLNFQQHLCSGAIFCRLGWPCRHTHAELLGGWILLVYLVVMQRASVTWGCWRSAGNTRRNVNMEGKNTLKTLQKHVMLHLKSNH